MRFSSPAWNYPLTRLGLIAIPMRCQFIRVSTVDEEFVESGEGVKRGTA